VIAASVFLYGLLLAVQGITALLPRRLFLRLSTILQIAAFGFLVTAYFLEPKLNTPAALALAKNHQALEWLPDYWFFALFNQLAGSSPPTFAWLATRAWIGFGASVIAAASSLLLCYLHTMRKTIEEPDLVPATRGDCVFWFPVAGAQPPASPRSRLLSLDCLSHRALVAAQRLVCRIAAVT